MVKELRNYHGKYFFTLVFASIFLFSFGILVQNVFADTVIATIPVGTNPSVVAINPNTNRIYVENSGEGTMSVIDGTSNTVLTKIAISSTAMDINKNTNMIYSISVYGPLDVSVINGSTNQVVTTIPINGGATGIAVNSNTNQIFVAEEDHTPAGVSGFIQVINGTTNTVVKTISTDVYNGNIVVNPNTNKVYLDYGAITVFDGTTYTVTAKIPGTTLGGLAINPVTNRLYDTYEGNPEIIDTSTNTVLGTIPVGYATIDAVNPVTNKIYFGNSGYSGANEDIIYVINGSTNTIVQKLQVGIDNRQTIGDVQIGVNPNTNKIYVANYGSNTVSVIDGSPTTKPLPPSTPAGVTAKAISSSQITISWTASAGATAYQLFNSTSPSGPFTKIGGTAATQYTSSGLPPSTTYYYEVRAGNTGGWSALSSPPVSATTKPLPPATPTGVTAKAISSSQITISWSASAGATAYQIFNSTSPSGPFTKIGGTAATQYTSSGLPPNTTYYYEVRAGNTGGWSALSSPPVSATTRP
jgi:DNA-binding beta-propeller fold protein YncE